MALPIVHPQPHYLYFDRWIADDDFILMEYMLTHQVKGEMHGLRADFDDAFVDTVYGELNEEFEYYHSNNAIKKRIAFFKKRYETFNFVKDYLGSVWEVADEYVRATTEAWVDMLQLKPFAAAYYLVDEPEYGHLKQLFGPHPDDVPEVVDEAGPASTAGPSVDAAGPSSTSG